MFSLIVGISLGFIAGVFYGSDRARAEAQRRVAAMPEPVRRTTESFTDAIGKLPLPTAVKQTASRATAAVQTGIDKAAQAGAPATTLAQPNTAEIDSRPADPLPTPAP